ncbi:MAG: FKBP-type peptidyl-prolyl cis-trans isomerase [Taibaiella sp.]|nr:FKBP-type peptidyl-prolyl cis-trans isomerase [Taibaiella sp.]
MIRKTLLFAGILSFIFSSCQDANELYPTIPCEFEDVEVPAEETDSLASWLSSEGISATKDARGFYYIVDSFGDEERIEHCYDVNVNYKVYLLDGSYVDAGTNTGFRVSGTIKGFGYGLTLIGNGGRVTLFLPPSLAYGETGSSPAVGPDEYLIFEVKMNSMVKNNSTY